MAYFLKLVQEGGLGGGGQVQKWGVGTISFINSVNDEQATEKL